MANSSALAHLKPADPFGTCAQAALIYASYGWRVIPVKGKQPAIREWPEKASNSPRTIHSWFRSHKSIGIVTGKESGIAVLDIDPRNGGTQSLQQLEEKLGQLPKTVTALSGGGGLHLVFNWFPGSKNLKPEAGIDFQYSSGRMIVAAPSLHPETGNRYQWLHGPGELPVADLPESWRAYLSNAPPKEATRELATIDHPTDFCAPIPIGKRNETLFQLGLLLRRQRQATAVISAALHEANLLRCQPPIPDEEVLQIVENVQKTATQGKSMKTRWQEAILCDKALRDGDVRVAIGLSMFADANGGSCFPNQDQIAESIAKTGNTVRQHLETLEARGWIKRYKHSRQGRGFSYGYMLTMKEPQI